MLRLRTLLRGFFTLLLLFNSWLFVFLRFAVLLTQDLFSHWSCRFFLSLSGYLTVELWLLGVHVVLLHLIEERCLLLLLSKHHLLLLLGHWLAWPSLGHHHAHVGVVVRTLA